ncbi:hypothetical protein ACNOYE_38595 [Nannocystaceae bacterium ST9]
MTSMTSMTSTADLDHLVRARSLGPVGASLALALALALAACGGGSSDDEVGETGESSSSESSTSESASETSGSESAGDSSESESESTSESSGSESESTSESSGSETATETATETGTETDTGGSDNPLWINPSLWYSIDDKLIYIEIDPLDGSVVQLQTSIVTSDPPLVQGQSGITLVLDEADEIQLLLTRVNSNSSVTQLHHVASPPTDGSPIVAEHLGMIPDNLKIEALYTDCQGLVYLMDTGPDVSSAAGNRLIRFTGDYLAGDLAYEVITDLQNASVADIDDMGPGIDAMNQITDGQGFAIDSGTVFDFDYNTGTGTMLGQAGTYGIHALGGPLFTDEVARLYVLDIGGNLYEADPVTLALSGVLTIGPAPLPNGLAGWSGLTGPLTECESTLPDPQ